MWQMPKLTDEEQRILQGEEGVVKQKCMQYLVELCQISGAEKLVDIDGTCDKNYKSFNYILHVRIYSEEGKRNEYYAKKHYADYYASDASDTSDEGYASYNARRDRIKLVIRSRGGGV